MSFVVVLLDEKKQKQTIMHISIYVSENRIFYSRQLIFCVLVSWLSSTWVWILYLSARDWQIYNSCHYFDIGKFSFPVIILKSFLS